MNRKNSGLSAVLILLIIAIVALAYVIVNVVILGRSYDKLYSENQRLMNDENLLVGTIREMSKENVYLRNKLSIFRDSYYFKRWGLYSPLVSVHEKDRIFSEYRASMMRQLAYLVIKAGPRTCIIYMDGRYSDSDNQNKRIVLLLKDVEGVDLRVTVDVFNKNEFSEGYERPDEIWIYERPDGTSDQSSLKAYSDVGLDGICDQPEYQSRMIRITGRIIETLRSG